MVWSRTFTVSSGCPTMRDIPTMDPSKHLWFPIALMLSSWTICLCQADASAKRSHEDIMHNTRPQITAQIPNVSVSVGRDALFTCHVKNLGDFKVGWVKEDTKAIQAIHDIVITHNPRVQVSGDFQTTFHLQISSVQEEDRGQYMCQINTVPMSAQTASLDVLVPPDITQSSGDRELRQGEMAKLECVADGYPTPTISWRREDNQSIKVKDPRLGIRKVGSYEGTTLTIPRVTPDDMGAYLCIAANDIPPARSKRVYLYVQFPPRIKVKEGIMGAIYFSNLKIKCHVQAYPKPIVYWNHTNGVLLHGGRYSVTEELVRPYEMTSTLTIHNVTALDIGKYSCMAKNSLAEASAIVRIYMLATPSPPTKATSSLFMNEILTDERQEILELTESNEVEVFQGPNLDEAGEDISSSANNRLQGQYDVVNRDQNRDHDSYGSKKMHKNFGQTKKEFCDKEVSLKWISRVQTPGQREVTTKVFVWLEKYGTPNRFFQNDHDEDR
eukprot:maker-scaffold71_size417697-snap-gene-2.15 protein:Tk11807 transcript:maker-scaffold71_size417697-snap-gene-2.15-mRNA-1 annotation:"GH24041"